MTPWSFMADVVVPKLKKLLTTTFYYPNLFVCIFMINLVSIRKHSLNDMQTIKFRIKF